MGCVDALSHHSEHQNRAEQMQVLWQPLGVEKALVVQDILHIDFCSLQK